MKSTNWIEQSKLQISTGRMDNGTSDCAVAKEITYVGPIETYNLLGKQNNLNPGYKN